MEVGLQETETPVMVLLLLLLLPPPQAMIPSSADMARSRARARKTFPQEIYRSSMNAANHYLNEKSGKQATGTLRRLDCCGAAGASNDFQPRSKACWIGAGHASG